MYFDSFSRIPYRVTVVILVLYTVATLDYFLEQVGKLTSLRNRSRCGTVLYSPTIQTTFRCTQGFIRPYKECVCFCGIDGALAPGGVDALSCCSG